MTPVRYTCTYVYNYYYVYVIYIYTYERAPERRDWLARRGRAGYGSIVLLLLLLLLLLLRAAGTLYISTSKRNRILNGYTDIP